MSRPHHLSPPLVMGAFGTGPCLGTGLADRAWLLAQCGWSPVAFLRWESLLLDGQEQVQPGRRLGRPDLCPRSLRV